MPILCIEDARVNGRGECRRREVLAKKQPFTHLRRVRKYEREDARGSEFREPRNRKHEAAATDSGSEEDGGAEKQTDMLERRRIVADRDVRVRDVEEGGDCR